MISSSYAGDNGSIFRARIPDRVDVSRWNEDSGSNCTPVPPTTWSLNCDSYENYDPGNLGENADGFATKFGLGTGNILRGCRAWNNSDDGYDCWNTDPPSESVTFRSLLGLQNGIDRWGAGSGFNGDGNVLNWERERRSYPDQLRGV